MIKFKATDEQVKLIIQRVLKASGFDEKLEDIPVREVLTVWRGKQINLLLHKRDEYHRLLHGPGQYHCRPWSSVLPDEVSIIEGIIEHWQECQFV